MLSPLALSLRIELTSPTNCKCIYKDCIVSLRRFLKLSLHHSIVNITEFHLDSDYDLCTDIASNQDFRYCTTVLVFLFYFLYYKIRDRPRQGKVRLLYQSITALCKRSLTRKYSCVSYMWQHLTRNVLHPLKHGRPAGSAVPLKFVFIKYTTTWFLAKVI